jgi:hypothetical protein
MDKGLAFLVTSCLLLSASALKLRKFSPLERTKRNKTSDMSTQWIAMCIGSWAWGDSFSFYEIRLVKSFVFGEVKLWGLICSY